jgi:hypothetical protein
MIGGFLVLTGGVLLGCGIGTNWRERALIVGILFIIIGYAAS